MRNKSIRELIESVKQQGNRPAPTDVEEYIVPKTGTITPKQLIGLTKGEAEKMIAGSGMICRISREDKQWFIGTVELRNDRMNLEIENGRVVNAAIA